MQSISEIIRKKNILQHRTAVSVVIVNTNQKQICLKDFCKVALMNCLMLFRYIHILHQTGSNTTSLIILTSSVLCTKIILNRFFTITLQKLLGTTDRIMCVHKNNTTSLTTTGTTNQVFHREKNNLSELFNACLGNQTMNDSPWFLPASLTRGSKIAESTYFSLGENRKIVKTNWNRIIILPSHPKVINATGKGSPHTSQAIKLELHLHDKQTDRRTKRLTGWFQYTDPKLC